MIELETPTTTRSLPTFHGLTLAQFVERRNGVPLGSPDCCGTCWSARLARGSGSSGSIWNPIWGYVLGKYVYTPLRRFLPAALALVLTFVISGAVHDLAAALVKGSTIVLFTPWFSVMSLVVVAGRAAGVDYAGQSFWTRVAINLAYVSGLPGPDPPGEKPHRLMPSEANDSGR